VVIGTLACLLKIRSNLHSYADPTRSLVNPQLLRAADVAADAAASSQAAPPNVVFIQHESLSGSIMLNTEKGKANTPFFHERMANDPDFYAFEHHRTGSGHALDAMPSLMTGCLPYIKKGMKYSHANGKAIGYEFAEKGYATASFSSRILDEDITEGKFGVLHDLLAGGMDRVEDASVNPNLEIDINDQGTSDGQMLPLFEEWLEEFDRLKEEEGSPSKPFYAQFYNFNNHYPYLDDHSDFSRLHGDNYITSMKDTDRFLEDLFEFLSSTGRLENTIIVGSSDHGEDPFKKPLARTKVLTSHILHSVGYVYYPRHLMTHEGMEERLRRNTQMMTHTLDIFPTLLSIVHGGNVATDGEYHDHPMSDPNTAADEGCIAGIDLAAVDIPEDRVTIAMNLVSGVSRSLTLWAISTKDFTLYHRTGRTEVYPLQQGRDNDYVLEFGSCTKDVMKLCMTDLSEEKEEYFRRAITSLRSYGSSFVGESVKTSKIVRFFVNILGGESAMEQTADAMAAEYLGSKESRVAFIEGESAMEQTADAMADEHPAAMESRVALIGGESAME